MINNFYIIISKIAILWLFTFQIHATDKVSPSSIDNSIPPNHSSVKYLHDFLEVLPKYRTNGKIRLNSGIYQDKRTNQVAIDTFHEWLPNLLNHICLSKDDPRRPKRPESLDYFSLSEAISFFSPYLKSVNFSDDQIEKTLAEYFAPKKDFTLLISPDSSKLPEPRDYFSSKELLDIDRMARLILKVTDNGSSILFLGNTPSYFGKRIISILSNEPNYAVSKNIFFMPFSGGADSRILRKNGCRLTDTSSPEGIKFLRKTFTQNGLSLDFFRSIEGTRLFVVDLKGSSGASINSFLFHTTNWLDVNDIKPPLFTFLFFSHHEGITEKELPFEYKVRTDILLNDKIVESDTALFKINVDNKKIEPDIQARIQPHFNACFWSEDYQPIIDSFPGAYAQELIRVIQAYKTPTKTIADS